MAAKLLNNFRKPQGVVGGILASVMNVGHGPMTRGVLERLRVRPEDAVLDIGCGGGGAVALMAATGATVVGVDYSETSARVAARKNSRAIREGRVRIQVADVDSLPFAPDSFSLVTAFETVYFWKNIERNFQDICGLLRPGGRFAVAVEAYLEGGKKMHCPALFNDLEMSLYSAEDLSGIAAGAGFAEIVTFKGGNGWLCVCCTKA